MNEYYTEVMRFKDILSIFLDDAIDESLNYYYTLLINNDNLTENHVVNGGDK